MLDPAFAEYVCLTCKPFYQNKYTVLGVYRVFFNGDSRGVANRPQCTTKGASRPWLANGQT